VKSLEQWHGLLDGWEMVDLLRDVACSFEGGLVA
jgi:hypothetical protein